MRTRAERRRHPLRQLRALWERAYEANVTGLAGMVAYNLLLSIFPFALLVLFVVGQVVRSETTEATVVAEIVRLFPATAEGGVERALRAVRDNATSIGIVALVGGIWVGSSFWGAMDTAFCRIYDRPCRSWVRQKLWALAMLLVSALFLAASVALPALQGAALVGAERVLPFDLAGWRALTLALSIAAGFVALFVVCCVIYAAVPRGWLLWRGVWPGALLATAAIGVVNWAFPLYLADVSTIGSLGGGLGFVLVVLIWFYAVALVLLLGAVLNGARLAQAAATRPPPRPVDGVGR